jgi:hypothetical protein
VIFSVGVTVACHRQILPKTLSGSTLRRVLSVEEPVAQAAKSILINSTGSICIIGSALKKVFYSLNINDPVHSIQL